MATGRDDGTPADYYDVLGVPDTASVDDIIRAYRRLARQHHPDRNPDGGSKRFQEISDAYDVIGDPDRRRAYDATRFGPLPPGARRIPVNHRRAAAAGQGGPRRAAGATAPRPPAADNPAATGPEGPPPGSQAPQADRPVIQLTFQEAVLGTTAAVEVTEDRPCGQCGGAGLEQPQPGGCPACGGTGSVIRRTGQIPVRHVCADCAGRGRAAPRPCPACGGTATVVGRRPVKVRIPAGVRDGATVRVPRKPPAADVFAVVRVSPDARFGRDGDDVTVGVPVSPAQAALGTTVEVPTPQGAALTIRVPAGSQPGRRFRVAGRGVRRPDRPGDLVVTIQVVIPTALSDAERAAYEALAAVSGAPPVPPGS